MLTFFKKYGMHEPTLQTLAEEKLVHKHCSRDKQKQYCVTSFGAKIICELYFGVIFYIIISFIVFYLIYSNYYAFPVIALFKSKIKLSICRLNIII